MSIEEKVVGIVSDQLDSPKDEISRSSSFVDDLKAAKAKALADGKLVLVNFTGHT